MQISKAGTQHIFFGNQHHIVQMKRIKLSPGWLPTLATILALALAAEAMNNQELVAGKPLAHPNGQNQGNKQQESAQAMNLIPVDQPVALVQNDQRKPQVGSLSSHPDQPVDQTAVEALASAVSPSPSLSDSSSANVGINPDNQSLGDDLDARPRFSGANGEAGDETAVEEFQLGDQLNRHLAAVASSNTKSHQQHHHHHQHHLRPQVVERRFGLFKKGNHYGQPMVPAMMMGQYSQSPYLTDCERCMASLNQNAELQETTPVIPVPAPVPVPVPVPAPTAPSPVPIQVPTMGGGSQSFGPIKNKLFMKFPFFMKPNLLGIDSNEHQQQQHWTQYQHQHPAQQAQYQPVYRPLSPGMSGALYIRPAAYNCIQAAPPLLAAPNAQEVALGGATKSGRQQQHQQQEASAVKQAPHHFRQEQQQQASYSSASY